MKTRYILCCLLVWLFVQGTFLSGAPPAGVVIYAVTEDNVYLLLADHRHPSTRGWSAFGGGAEEGETPAETAARETEEETRGFLPREAVLERIADQKPVIDGTFHLYFLEIEFLPARRIENNVLTVNEPSYREREYFAWIPYSEIEQHLTCDTAAERQRLDKRFLPKRARTDWLWEVWVRNMRVALEGGDIPWAQGLSRVERIGER